MKTSQEKLNDIINNKDFTKTKLAKTLKINYYTLSRYFNGDKPNRNNTNKINMLYNTLFNESNESDQEIINEHLSIYNGTNDYLNALDKYNDIEQKNEIKLNDKGQRIVYQSELKEIRLLNVKTLQQVAKDTNINYSLLSKIENGESLTKKNREILQNYFDIEIIPQYTKRAIIYGEKTKENETLKKYNQLKADYSELMKNYKIVLTKLNKIKDLIN